MVVVLLEGKVKPVVGALLLKSVGFLLISAAGLMPNENPSSCF